MHPKDAARIANSIDPDQRSSLIWVCTICPELSVRKLRIITASFHTAAPSCEYYVQLRSQCKNKSKIAEDIKSAIVRYDKNRIHVHVGVSAERGEVKSRLKTVFKILVQIMRDYPDSLL